MTDLGLIRVPSSIMEHSGVTNLDLMTEASDDMCRVRKNFPEFAYFRVSESGQVGNLLTRRPNRPYPKSLQNGKPYAFSGA